jgi:ABC-type multidrug transport system ATPase subunit
MSVIEVQHLRKRYRDVVAVDDVSFTVEHGEIFGILGPNGAGKTTTVEIIEGLRTADDGTVRVLELDPQARRDTWELIEQIRNRGVTVVLVTHFMEEAERLADRVAVIDTGRLVAIDSPAGLVSRLDSGQRIRFRPTTPLDDRILTELPEVHGVERSGAQVLVTGTGDLLQAVTSVLARHHIVAAELRMEQANLDDAFMALTAHEE